MLGSIPKNVSNQDTILFRATLMRIAGRIDELDGHPGMRPYRNAAFSLVFVTTVLAGASTQAGEPGAPAAEFVRTSIERVLNILKDRHLNHSLKLARLRKAFETYFDHPFIARYAAGRYYDRAPPDVQIDYVNALEEFLVHAYGSRMLLYGKEIDLNLRATDIFTITGQSEPRPNYFIVHTHINRRLADLIRINWHLRRRHGQYKVVDVVVMGVSQARRYRSDFVAAMDRAGSGLHGLTSTLRTKVDAYRREALGPAR